MATIKKAQNGATKDSTSYFKNKEKSFRQLSKTEKGDSEVSKFNKRFFENEAGKAVTSQVRQSHKGKPGYDKNGYRLKMKNGGSLSALNASNKRDKGTDVGGAYTTVQKKALAGAKGKASLTKDKQLGATKMQNGGSVGSKVVKENPRQQKRLSRIRETNPERAERVEKRMVKRADRAMGARGAASRMKSGGSVKKK
jgi:hypothetical protein